MNKMGRIAALLVAVMMLLSLTTAYAEEESSDLTPITVQLKWIQQAQFMGYYAALELGIYEAYGLDVTIVQGGYLDVVDEVDSGRANFGVDWVSTIMQKISAGANVLSISQSFQTSAMTLVSLAESVANGDAVSEGESVGSWGSGSEYEMQTYLTSLGLDTAYVTQDYDMQQVLTGEIEWASAMTYNEVGLMLEAGRTYEDMNVLYMEDEGFGMLEDCLIVNAEWAVENEETVLAFMAATNLGWAWCLENQAAAGSLVFNAEDTSNTVSEYHQQYEAVEIAKLVAGDLVTIGDRSTYTMIGYMDAEKYELTYDILASFVDIANISATSSYSTYFYDLLIADETYLDALENLDIYTWDGTYEVLYTEE